MACGVFGAEAQPPIRPGDMETIKQPLDFLRQNISHDGQKKVRAGRGGGGGGAGGGEQRRHAPRSSRSETMGTRRRRSNGSSRRPRGIGGRGSSSRRVQGSDLHHGKWAFGDGLGDARREGSTTRSGSTTPRDTLRRARAGDRGWRGYFAWYFHLVACWTTSEWAEGV